MEKYEQFLPYTYKYQADNFKLEEYFDLDYLLDTIKTLNKKQIILQFPVFQISDAIKVQSYLAKHVENKQTKFYVLSDHLKQPCCVDVVGAQHMENDMIIHFGQACFSEKYNENIYYVLPKMVIDIDSTKKLINEHFDQNKEQETFVIFDQEYEYVQKQFSYLNEQYNNCDISYINVQKNFKEENRLFFGYQSSKFQVNILNENKEQKNENIQKKDLILVSSNEQSKLIEKLFFLKEKFFLNDIYILVPENQSLTKINFRINGPIMKRIHLIEEAKNIDSFGVLVCNPNTQFCQNVLKRTRSIIRQASKKCFTFVMNNMNESKLNNFPEVDAYVVISCHNNSLFEYKDFYKLLITPFELELALNDQSYSSYFLLDGSHIEEYTEPENDVRKCGQCCGNNIICGCKEKSDELCKNQEEEQKEELTEQQLVLKEEKNYQIATQKIFQTLDFYKNRLYQGLDIHLEKEVCVAKPGLSGIAQQYKHEKEQ